MKKQVALAVFLVAAMANAAAAAMPPVNVTGKWDFNVETSAGAGSPKFEFKQEGESLTGSYEGQLGSAKLTGTVKGNEITFRFTVELGEVVYTGTVDGDTMKGKIKLGEYDGTFTGKKAAK
jgi:opacity protein-like surface antigen